MDATRFDAFARSLAHLATRRRLLQLLAGFGLGAVLARPAEEIAARVGDCPLVTCPGADDCLECKIDKEGRCWCTCATCSTSGIAGGGTVAAEGGGEAHLALLATRVAVPDQSGTFAIQGQVRWVDPAAAEGGLSLESAAITFYGPLPEIEGGREAAGWMRVNGRGEYPFVLRAVDAGPPGAGTDTVALWVGDAVLEDPAVAGTPAPDLAPSGFRYVAEGTLVSGDLQLVRLASAAAAGAPGTATPAT